MTATARGSKVKTVMYEETVYGTAPTTPGGIQLPAIENSLALTRAMVKSRVLRGDRNPTRGDLGRKAGAGGLLIQPDVRSIAFVMKHAIGGVTTTGAGPYTHVIKIADLPIGLTIDKFFSDVVLVNRYLGFRINQFSFQVNDDGLLEMQVDGIHSDKVEDTTLLDAAPTLYSVQGFSVPLLTFNEGGAPCTIGKDFQLTYMNNLDGEIGRTMGNTGAISELPEGAVGIDFSMSVLFKSRTLLDKAKNHTESQIALTFPARSSGHSLAFSLEEVDYEVGDAEVKTPGGIVVPMKGSAHLDDGASSSALVVTVINDVASLTAFPA